MDGRHYTDLCVSQVRVPTEEDGDVVGRLTYLLHDQLQLLHALPRLGLAALQVGGHEAQLLAPERHLKTGGGGRLRTPVFHNPAEKECRQTKAVVSNGWFGTPFWGSPDMPVGS